MRAINTHIDNADVCYAGCGALLNMTANGKKQLIKQNIENEMNS